MKLPVVQSNSGVTLVGGAPVSRALLHHALQWAPVLVAADSGADRLLALGLRPEAVIGDFDSLRPSTRAALAPDILHPVAEQDSTDFEKALRAIAAPFVLAVGFSGARIDHELAVFNALVRHPGQRCLVVSPSDVSFLAPRRLAMDLPRGTRLSLFPMGRVSGTGSGLRWPIAGIRFAPDGAIGTSNEVTGPVDLRFSARRMIVILPRARLSRAIASLVPGHAPGPVRDG